MCYFFDRLTGRTIENVINMGSYNYLGFAENNADFLKTVAEKTRQYGVGVGSTRQELGMCGYTTNETYLQSQKQVTHRIQHCLFKNKHSRLLSNYFGLVNAIINLSKAFFPLVSRPALSSVHRIPPSQICVMISQKIHNDLPRISMLKYVYFFLKKALILRFPQWYITRLVISRLEKSVVNIYLFSLY